MRFTTPPGGVLLEDDRVIKGDVRIARDVHGVVTIRKVEEEQSFVVADGPAGPELTLDVIMARLAHHPGHDDSGRPMPTSLAATSVDGDGYIDDEPIRLGDELF